MGAKDLLDQDLAVGLGLLGVVDDALEHVIELSVGGLEGELLGHEVHGDRGDALELGQALLQLAGAVSAVDLVELECLLHGGFPSVVG